MKLLRRISTIAGILLIAVGIAVGLVLVAPEPEQQERPPNIPFVETGQVFAGDAELEIVAHGVVQAAAVIDVVPQVSGKVAWVSENYRSGGRVIRDESLIRIEDLDFVNQLKNAEYEVAEAELALASALEEARIAVDSLDTFLKRRESDDVARGELSNLATHELQVNAARAKLASARANESNAQLALQRTRIASSINGLVESAVLTEGQFVAAGQSIGRIVGTDSVEVRIALSEAEASLIPDLWRLQELHPESRPSARVSSEIGESHIIRRGRLDRVEHTVDRSSQTIHAFVRVGQPFDSNLEKTASGGIPLLIGQFVEVDIQGSVLPGSVQIPRLALQPGNMVWLVGTDSRVSVKPVQVVYRARTGVWVKGDLSKGNVLITNGLDYVVENMQVRF